MGSQVCPRWDPGWDLANPTWDPDRDFGTSHMGSHLESQVGSRQSHPGSQLHSRQNPANPAWDPASNPRWDPANPTRDPGFVPHKIPPSHLATYVCPRWDPANPTWEILNLYHVRSQVGSCNLTWGHLFLTQTGSHLLSFLIYPQIPVPALEHV